jgi:type I restriction enzyme S subunit
MSKKLKDSGVEWIGYIPKNWPVQRLKKILIERNEKNDPIKTDFILSLMKEKGVIPYSEKGNVGNKSKEKLTGYKLAYPNDIVLNSMNIIIGSVGLSKYFGAVSPVYYMLRLRINSDSPKYFNYLFQTSMFQKRLIGYGNGIMEHRMRIQMSKLNTVNLPYPSSEEQNKIANFLDEKVTQINSIIDETKQSINELKEYKKSLITETVTKGLNSDVEVKDSLVNYIGKIPAHWGVVKIKNVLTPLNRPVLNTDEVITCFRDGEVTLRKNRREDGFTFSNTENGYQGVEKGDLVFHGLDAFAGAIGISDARGKCSPVVHVCDSKYNKKYIMYFLRALAFNDVYMALSDGVRIRSSDYRNWNKLAKILVILPPLEEQKQISVYIDTKCSNINSLINKKEQLIKEMEEYKNSIIYEYVTGKKEVM